MKVEIITRRQKSYDGYNVSTYDPGDIVEPRHEAEKQFFAELVRSGHAKAVKVQHEEVAAQHPVQKTEKKVVKPTKRKATKK